MEPIDSDYEYTARSADPKARFNWLYILPIAGALIVLLFAAAAIFQFSITALVNPLMGFLMLLFFILVILLFWGAAANQKRA